LLGFFSTTYAGAYLTREKELPSYLSSLTLENDVILLSAALNFENIPLKEGSMPMDFKIWFQADKSKLEFLSLEYNNQNFIASDEGKEDFRDAALASLGAIFAYITVREHILSSHLMIAGGLSTANMLLLPGVHPIRRLTASCEFGVHDVNEGGFLTLLSFHGIVPRVYNFFL